MATIVEYVGIWLYDKTTRRFRVSDRCQLHVTEFSDGIATLEPMLGDHINSYAEMVAGCFEDGSNFKEELLKSYPEKDSDIFHTIKFKFNGVKFFICSMNANKESIVEQYHKGLNMLAEEYKRERDAYMKTPEYKAKRAKELKVLTRKERVQKEVVEIEAKTRLRYKDKEAAKVWREFVRINSKDGYSEAIVTYAKCWAKYMQHLMKSITKLCLKLQIRLRIYATLRV